MNERDMRRFFGDGPSIRVGATRKRRKRRRSLLTGSLFAILGAGAFVNFLAVLMAAAIGGFFFDYSLMTIFAKDIPWYADCIVGLVTCPITVAVGLGCWVAVLCDVETPFVQSTPPTAEAPMDPTNG